MAKQRHESSKVWRNIAIVCIVLFIVIITLGILRVRHFRSDYHPAQQSQIDLAKNSVANDLISAGDNISNYNISTSNLIRDIDRDEFKNSVIQISLYNSNTIQNYLVDAETGNIVVHTKTMFYGWMRNMSSSPPQNKWIFLFGGR